MCTISIAAGALLAEAADLGKRQRRVAAVDVADHVGIGFEDDVRVDQPGARDRWAAGVDRALDAVFARPGDHPLRLVALLDAAEPDLAEQLDAGLGHLAKILLDHALLEHRRAGVQLDPARTEGGEGALRRDRERLDPDHVPGRPGRWTSPAETMVVTPPCRKLSIQFSWFWRGVQSPNTG